MGITITNVVNSHRLTTKTGDGLDLVVMSGTALCSFKGDGDTFRRDEMYVNIGPRWRRIDDVAPMAALASWYDDKTAVNAGAAVDSCGWIAGGVGEQDSRLRLVVAVGVSDKDAILYRFAYTATAVGIISPIQDPGPGEGSLFS